MSKKIIADATKAQVLAARPGFSSWISANAGSGKTRVLTNRVSRLLLSGTDPAKILCLTFTTAAAAEMQNRLFKQLGQWVMLPDADLQSALHELGEPTPSGAELIAARTLFARALETPGGLKIQTIHAFCESLLHRFPLEARISPDFEIMDDRQQTVIQTDILNNIAENNEQVFDALVAVQTKNPADFLPEIIKNQERFEKPFDVPAMAKLLGAEPNLTETEILGRIMRGFSDSLLQTMAQVMVKTANPDAKKIPHQLIVAKALTEYKFAPVSAALDMLERAFLTSGKPRSTKSFPVNAVKTAFPPSFDLVTLLIERVACAHESRVAVLSLEKSRALHAFSKTFLDKYTAHKADIGHLEFEDLIRKTEFLLRNSDMAQWILYRLDGGIDHILVDEAQDTSPLQWKIISSLAEEIYATAEPDRPRTVFVVGDEKQSIFSFQGADPLEFARMRSLFDAQLKARGAALSQGDLLHSFRSAAPILRLVDKVFSGSASDGLSAETTHLSTDECRPGRVEIWPFLENPEKPEKKGWDEAIDALPPGNPKIEVAKNVASRIADLISSGHELPGEDRPVRAGDFLILLQSRDIIFHGIIKALKTRSVPVAGADRLKVVEELAVKDLLACLQFAASPNDDLALACALRSPLCGMSEADLFRLAQGRKGILWHQMNAQEMLSDLLSHADFERPYELLERILLRHGGRKKLLARLGPEAEDGIDELLRQALMFETVAAPSLTGFLDWISTDEIEVKRQMDDESDQVRVMTIHGAKGLESPIVILPQTVKTFNNSGLTVVPLGGLAAMGMSDIVAPQVLKTKSETRKRLLQEEKNRLLYVALTRAKSWLMIAGAGNRKRAGANWYDMTFEAAKDLGAQFDDAGRLVYENNWSSANIISKTSDSSVAEMPHWLLETVEKPLKPAKSRNPSLLGGAHTLSGTAEDEDALLRGSQIHMLLENLVDIEQDKRRLIAEQMLGKAEIDGVINEALKVMAAPVLADIFAKTSLREVALSANIAGIGPVSGRIDALLVGDEITAIDFKSNTKIPLTASEIPEGFLRQMGAYRAALGQIWPDKKVNTAICWTHNTSLMEISEKQCIAALQRASKT